MRWLWVLAFPACFACTPKSGNLAGGYLTKMKDSILAAIKNPDSVTAEMSHRLDEVTQDVKDAVDGVERAPSATDSQMRKGLREKVKVLTNYVETLSGDAFKQTEEAAKKLEEDADKIK